MPDTAPTPALPVPPPPPGTPAPAVPHETLGQRVGDFFHRADADVQALVTRAPGIEADIRDHAGQVFSVASEVVNLLGLIDPAAAPAVAAGDVVLAKVLSMVTSAAAIAAKVTPPGTGKSGS